MKILTQTQMIQYMAGVKALTPADGRTRKDGNYLDCVCAFDIETSTIMVDGLEQAVMFIWQFACEDRVTYGRTWPEYARLLDQIREVTPPETRLVIYVHNLSFEFQFLAGIFSFSPDDVFCTAPRKVLRARCDQVEYRCSYLLSNDTLAGFGGKHHVEHLKQSGYKFDYLKTRYSWTPLTLFEMKYALYDVVGLVEAVHAEMAMNGDDLYSIPLTSTGYVRRDVRKVLYHFNHTYQRWLQPDSPHLYNRLRECFRGGNTHANRFFSDQTLEAEDGPYWKFDISSSYPTQMCMERMPMSTWRPGPTDPKLIADLRSRGYCMLVVLQCFQIRLRDKFNGFPPLSESKCRHVYQPILDNGRILSAVYLETTLTDIDLDILLDNYTGEFTFIETWYCKYDYLPVELRDYIKKLYIDKTALKGVTGDIDGESAEVRYMQAKARINSIYGLSVQDNIGRPLVKYINGEYKPDPEFDIENAIAKNLKGAYMSYSWGCWITALARRSLERSIRQAEKTGFVLYCDTDSIMGCGPIDLTELNNERIYYAKKWGCYADDVKGHPHYMGLYEQEDDMKTFKTMGAKKYAYTDSDDKVHITIAGVAKMKGAEQLAKAGGLDAMKDGFTFKEVNTEAVYNDLPDYGSIIIDGHEQHITRNVALVPSDYTLGLTGEYNYILEHPEVFRDIWAEY